jgi:hypothetical protein
MGLLTVKRTQTQLRPVLLVPPASFHCVLRVRSSKSQRGLSGLAPYLHEGMPYQSGRPSGLTNILPSLMACR